MCSILSLVTLVVVAQLSQAIRLPENNDDGVVIYPPTTNEHYQGELADQILKEAYPEGHRLVGLKVLQAKQVQYGNFAGNYDVRVAVGVIPECPELQGLEFKGLCDIANIKSVEIHRIQAVEYNGRVKVLKKQALPSPLDAVLQHGKVDPDCCG